MQAAFGEKAPAQTGTRILIPTSRNMTGKCHTNSTLGIVQQEAGPRVNTLGFGSL